MGDGSKNGVGTGMRKHGRSGHNGKSPKMRHHERLLAERNEVKDRTRLKDPKESVSDLFHKKP
jgi:hypothetical protein